MNKPVIRYAPIHFFPPTPKSRWMREQIEARAIVQVLRAVKAWNTSATEQVDPFPSQPPPAPPAYVQGWAEAVLSVERVFEST